MVYICGEGNGTPLQYSCLENPTDGGAWWAAIHGVTKSRTRLSDFTFTFPFHALEKEMAIHSSVLALRITGTGEPDGLPSMPLKPGAVHRAAPHPIQSGRDYPCPLGPVDNSATQERPRFETKQISMPADLRLITRTCLAGIERRAAPPHAGLSSGLDRDPRPGAQVLIPGTWGKGLPGKRHLYRGS